MRLGVARLAKRDALNTWIRTSGAYEAVIDFDKVTRSRRHRQVPADTHDSGGHLHPRDAGHRATGEAIDLAPSRATRP